MSLTSVLGIVAVCVVSQCEAWPKIGQKAYTDDDCVDQAIGLCSCDSLGEFTCAQLNGVYVSNKTMCDFCKTYGLSDAIVYHKGEEIRCAELEPGYRVIDDPQCAYLRSNSENIRCPEEKFDPNSYHCAKPYMWSKETDGVYGETRCKFCQKYGGDRNYMFYGTGRDKCTEIVRYLQIVNRPGEPVSSTRKKGSINTNDLSSWEKHLNYIRYSI